MKVEPFDVSIRPDRLATTDEVRSALSFLPDICVDDENDSGWEVASDLGGYVRIELAGDNLLTLIEQLDGSAN